MTRPARSVVRRALWLGAAVLLATISCGREVTGPSGLRVMHGFTFDVRFPFAGLEDGEASQLVPFTQVRVRLVTADGRVVIDRVVEFPANATEVPLSFSVPISPSAPASGELMDLSLAYINAAGDTVFRAGPQPVPVVPTGSGTPPQPPVLTPVFVGPGSEATSVVITPERDTLLASVAFNYSAVALDGQGQPVANAPIGWRSATPARASIAALTAGAGTTLAARGPALIVAQLLSGAADTVFLEVLPRAQTLQVAGGNAQSGAFNSALAAPIVARVLASDGLPLEGVDVTFAVETGGGSLTQLAVTTDGDGEASTNWTLGDGLGAQTVSATAAGLTGSPLIFTANAPSTQLLHAYAINGDLTDAVGGADGALVGAAALEGGALTLDGASGYAQLPAHLIPTSGSYSVSLFVRNRTSLSFWAEYISQGTLGDAFFIGHDPNGFIRVGDAWLNTGFPTPPIDGLYHHFVVTVDAVTNTTNLHVDGVLRASLPQAITSSAVGTGTRLGRQHSSNLEYLDGEIDEVRIWRGAIPASLVTSLYESGVSAFGRLVFQAQPAGAGAGAVLSPVIVRVEDGLGRLRADFNGNVTIALSENPGGAALGGTLVVSAANGIATFSDLSLDAPAPGYRLSATATGSEPATSAAFTISAGSATQLVFVQQPSAATEGDVISPAVTVEARDAGGFLASAYTGSVTLAIGTNPGGGVLGGTLSVNAVGGVATFADLTVSLAGIGYTLVASATGLSSDTSDPFTVVGLSEQNVWLNTAGGVWSSAADWSLGRVPIATDTVLINAAGTYTVTLDGPVSVRALLVGGGTGTQTLAVANRTLSIAELLRIEPSGAMTTSGGTVNGTGTLVNVGLITMLGGTIATSVTNEGTAVFQGTTGWTGAVANQPGAMMRIQGNTGPGAASASFTLGFTNEGAIELTSVGGAFASSIGMITGVLVNAPGGTIATLPGAGGNRALFVAIENQGTITIGTTTQQNEASAAHVNSGLISIAAGQTMTVQQTGTAPSFTNAGTITVASGGSFRITGGTANLTGGVLEGAAGSLITTSVTSLAFTTASVTTPATLNTTTVAGTFTIPAGDTLRLLDGSPTFTLVNEGTLLLQGNVTLGGSLTSVAGSVISSLARNGSGSAMPTITNGFTNNGLIELRTQDAFYTNTLTVGGTLLNASGGTIRSVPGSGGKTLSAQLDNQGVLQVDESLTLNRASATHLNSGSINVALANLTVTQTGTTPSFTNAGVITLASGRQVTVTGGTLTLTGGTFDGPLGSLVTTNVTLNFDLASAQTTFDLNTTTVPGTFTIPAGDTLRLSSGSPIMTLVNEGTLLLQGNVVLGGSLTTVATSVISSFARNGPGSATPTITNGFTNNGLVELRTQDAFYSNTLTVGGTLVNAGLIRSVPGSGGKTLAAQLDNQGVLQVDESLTLNRASAVHVNNGSINVALANLTVTQTGTTPSFTNAGVITLASGRQVTVTGGTLTLTGGTFDGPLGSLVTTNVTLNFDLASAQTTFDLNTTTVPGTFTIPSGDTLRLSSGSPTMTLVNEGTLLLQGNVALGGSLTSVAGSVISSLARNGPGSATPSITNGFTNNGLIELRTLDAFYANTLTVGGTLVNVGLIRSVPGNGGKTLAAQLDNQGVLQVDESLTLNRASAVHVNSGSINVALANLTVPQTGTTPSFTNAGVITLASGRQLSVTGGTLTLTGGTLDGDAATLVTTNVTLNFDLASAKTSFDLNTTSVPGTFTIPAGDTLRLSSGSPTMTLVNEGTLLLQSNVTLGGSLTSVAGSVISSLARNGPGSATPTITNGFTNNGLIELRTQDAFYTNTLTVGGTLVNSPSGTIRTVPGNGSKGLAVQLDNQGLVQVDEALTLNRASAVHVNTGTINVALANLTITQSVTTPSFTNAGLITLASGRMLNVIGGTLNLTGGTLDGPLGSLVTTNVTLNFDLASAQTTFDLNTTTVPGTFTIPAGDTLRLSSGSPTMTLVNEGTLLLQSNVALGGSLTSVAGSVISTLARNGPGSATPSITNGFTNNGLIELRTQDAFYTNTLTVGGTLVNSSSGTIRSVPGSGGKTLSAQLDNQGLLQVDELLTINRASAAHVNNGTINVALANLTVTQTGTTPSFTNAGLLTLASGRQLSVTGGTLSLTGGTLDGAAGALVTNNVTLNFDLASAQTSFGLTNTTVPGTFTIAAGDTLWLDSGSPTMTLVNEGTLLLQGNVTLGGSLTSVAGSVISSFARNGPGSATPTITNGFTNNGLVELRTQDAFYTNTLTVGGTLVNSSSGTIRSVPGSGGKTLAAQLDNQGVLQVDELLTLNRASATHLNSGAINVALANLTVTQTGTTPSFANAGGASITLASGRTLTVTNGALDLRLGNTLGGASTVAVTNTALQLDPATFEPRLSISGAATLPGTLTIGAGDSLRVDNGAFNPAALAVNGTLILEGTVQVNTALNVNGGGEVWIRSSNATTGAGVGITNGFTNDGTIRIFSIDAARSTTLSLGAAPFVNGATGTLRFEGGAGGGRFFTAGSIENLGTIAGDFSGTINGPIAQRNILTVAGGQTLSLQNLLTLYTGSNSTATGTLARLGGCTQDGTPTFVGFTCP